MRETAIRLELSNHAPSEGVAVLTERSLPVRVGGALLAWLGLWIAMFVCVFIPLLHFVLVPTLFIAGPVVGVLRFLQRTTIAELRATCPRCQGAMQASGKLKDGRALWCSGCAAQPLLRLTPPA